MRQYGPWSRRLMEELVRKVKIAELSEQVRQLLWRNGSKRIASSLEGRIRGKDFEDYLRGDRHLPADLLPLLAAGIADPKMVFLPFVEALGCWGIEGVTPKEVKVCKDDDHALIHEVLALERPISDLSVCLGDALDEESPGGIAITAKERAALAALVKKLLPELYQLRGRLPRTEKYGEWSCAMLDSLREKQTTLTDAFKGYVRLDRTMLSRWKESTKETGFRLPADALPHLCRGEKNPSRVLRPFLEVVGWRLVGGGQSCDDEGLIDTWLLIKESHLALLRALRLARQKRLPFCTRIDETEREGLAKCLGDLIDEVTQMESYLVTPTKRTVSKPKSAESQAHASSTQTASSGPRGIAALPGGDWTPSSQEAARRPG